MKSQLFTFCFTAALVALVTTGCLEGPLDHPEDADFPTAQEADAEPDAVPSGMCSFDDGSHEACSIACEYLQECDALAPVDEDTNNCVWRCTGALLADDEGITTITQCAIASGGECGQVLDCVGASPEEEPEHDVVEIPSADDTEIADEAGSVTVAECETACDAYHMCNGSFDFDWLHQCFEECLFGAETSEVLGAVDCVLSSNSCGEVVACVDPEIDGPAVPDELPEHPMVPDCIDGCALAIECMDEVDDMATCINDCIDLSFTAGGQDLIACVVEAHECDSFNDCMAEFTTPGDDQEDADDAACAAHEDCPPGLVCQDGVCQPPAHDDGFTNDTGAFPDFDGDGLPDHPLTPVCVDGCEMAALCMDDADDIFSCVNDCLAISETPDGPGLIACVLAADECDTFLDCIADFTGDGHEDEDVDTDMDGTPDHEDAFPHDASESQDTDGDGIGDNAQSNDESNNQEDFGCPPEGCPDGSVEEVTCFLACGRVTPCMDEGADQAMCLDSCLAAFNSPEGQESLSCVFGNEGCDALLDCGLFDHVPTPDASGDDGYPDEDIAEVPFDEDDTHGHPCFGPEATEGFGCGDIVIEKELMITDLSVIEDPSRTFDGCTGTPMGAWTFGKLMADMAPVDADGGADTSGFMLNFLESWLVDQELNGFVSSARPSISQQIIEPWLARSGGQELDPAKAPFRLLAVVNRVDLRNTSEGPGFSAGEGRFVFGLVDVENGCTPLEYTVIFEYGLPASDLEGVQNWALDWHQLGGEDFAHHGGDYNSHLQGVTSQFAARGANPHKINGNAINQIRTNEISLGGPWELREFRLQADGQLAQVSCKQEPGAELRNSDDLADWVNDNADEVLNSTHTVPSDMLGPAAPVEGLWLQDMDVDPQVRHTFALNTCSGCHQAETGTPFLHVGTRSAGLATPLSGFLVGTEISDPVSGEPRVFNDLERRMLDLCNLVSPEATAADVHDVDPAPACAP
jgi:hypothetical protein